MSWRFWKGACGQRYGHSMHTVREYTKLLFVYCCVYIQTCWFEWHYYIVGRIWFFCKLHISHLKRWSGFFFVPCLVSHRFIHCYCLYKRDRWKRDTDKERKKKSISWTRNSVRRSKFSNDKNAHIQNYIPKAKRNLVPWWKHWKWHTEWENAINFIEVYGQSNAMHRLWLEFRVFVISLGNDFVQTISLIRCVRHNQIQKRWIEWKAICIFLHWFWKINV